MGQENWKAMVAQQSRCNGRMWFGVAFRILHDVQASEDVCQQALAKALEHGDQIRDHGRLGGWLTQVVVNESLQVLRRRKTERLVLAATAQAQQPLQPQQTIELKDTVRAALEQLPEVTRTIVVLRIMSGLSGNEVKDMLGCSASEVSRRLHEGMEQLRHLLPR